MKAIGKAKPWLSIVIFALGCLVGMISLKALPNLLGGDESREATAAVQSSLAALQQKDLERRRETEELTARIEDLAAQLAEAGRVRSDLESTAASAKASASEAKKKTQDLERAIKQYQAREQSSPMFCRDNPFPIGYDKVRPGQSIGLAGREYPNGKFHGIYEAEIASPAFSRVIFVRKSAPAESNMVSRVAFKYRDESQKARVRAEALRTFGSEKLISYATDKNLIWGNIGGFEVQLDDGGVYNITKW